jgi:hypothetical protein
MCQCRGVPIEADLDVVCPRCGSAGQARFYGPCESCRDELRATLGNDGHLAEVIEYEPKMNVTPNSVAVKD